jgi:putative endonuclease
MAGKLAIPNMHIVAGQQAKDTAQHWLVYLLECADGTLYCGITTNMPRRLAQHNGHQAGGARYTRGRRPVFLRASLTCASRSHALRLEASIKKLPSPAAKLSFMHKAHPLA